MNNQLRLRPRTNSKLLRKNFIIKFTLIIVVCFFGIFLLDKIDFPTPTKLIEQKIKNDKFITIK